jgi:hypothetical protein
MPIDVAMEKPGAGIVRKEADCDIISSVTDTHDISDNRIVEVVGRAASGADHMEVVTVQMNRVLSRAKNGHKIRDILAVVLKYALGYQEYHRG